ncbi:UBX domain-containing protein 11-like [Oscarella lobularis]|uniref:UBX domain-containing protein 11-like n=1 Tax=Oscarella lobularis TaxID=121494 RepID=UPI00331341BD
MSSPESSLKKTKKLPISPRKTLDDRKRAIPYRSSPLALKSSDVLPLAVKESDRQTTPSDEEFIGSMARRLGVLERQLIDKGKELIGKDEKIRELEEKLSYMRMASAPANQQITELQEKCRALQKQVQDMENFLADYGMIWVGDEDGEDDDDSVTDASSERNMWNPASSIAKESEFCMNFNLAAKNIEELNALAGEGVAQVAHTTGGAKLKFPDPISLTLYQNGFVMFAGPFRPYSDPTAQKCMQDIMDGYFPSELQQRYPDGTPFALTDRREEVYQDRRHQTSFPGAGRSLQGDRQLSSVEFSEAKSHGSPVSTEQFLRRLPKAVVRKGKVIDVRSEIAEHVKCSGKTGSTTLVETPIVGEIRSQHSLTKDVTTLRVKSETGDQTYLIKMRYDDTISDLRKYINNHRGYSCIYEIRSAFPNRLYDNEDDTLSKCGLVPNAALYLK